MGDDAADGHRMATWIVANFGRMRGLW